MTLSDELKLGLDGEPLSTAQLSAALQTLDATAPDVTSVEVVSDVIQPGSRTGVLKLGTSAEPRQIFVKKVAATHEGMANRPWADRRRTLAYARTEQRFYEEFVADPALAPRFAATGVSLPKLCGSENKLDALLGDDPVHALSAEEPSAEVQQTAGAILLVECAEGYTQGSPLTEWQAEAALRAVAGLHAAFWEEKGTLQTASERLQRHGGVYALEIRSKAEIAKIKPNWDAFVEAFKNEPLAVETRLFELPGMQTFGERLDAWYEYASSQVSPGPTDQYATLVHGDFKAMNVMLPGKDGVQPMLIDFASTGVGYGMCDVAMLLAHSVAPSVTENGGHLRLINCYLDALKENGVTGYDRDVAMRHYHLATVDYARFVVARFWGGASPEAFAKRADNPNVCLPNRNVEAALRFAESAETSLWQLEQRGRI